MPSMPTQTPPSLAAVSRWWLFFGNQQKTRKLVEQFREMTFSFGDQHRTRRRVDQSGTMSFFFGGGGGQQRTPSKVDQPKDFAPPPPRNKFCPPKNNVLAAALA